MLCLDGQAFIKVLWFLCVNYFKLTPIKTWSRISFPGGSDSKETASNSGDLALIPGSGRSLGYPLSYSCLENSMDGGAWWATVHGVAKNWTRLSDQHSQEQVDIYVFYFILETLA